VRRGAERQFTQGEQRSRQAWNKTRPPCGWIAEKRAALDTLARAADRDPGQLVNEAVDAC
jgi:hypothetical protein